MRIKKKLDDIKKNLEKIKIDLQNTGLLILLSLTVNLLVAQDYSFDFEEFEKKPYESVGNLQLQSDFSELNSASNLYKLSFLNKEDKDFWDSYFASVQLKGSYEFSKFKFSADLKD
ncbi:MAG: hypothetical protein U9N34_07115, partial [Candidatus Cloacimonadota bacterium]|nr:hypothetical protein [Candidatus Cloacimonadota bacterium]